jgi:glycerol-1-phosphate dehydrogenase [NAD(P)+]
MADASAIYGSTFVHGGRSIHIDPELAVYDRAAIERVPEAARRFGGAPDACVLMDARTREVAGSRVARTLSDAGVRVKELVVPDRPGGGSPVCDDLTRDALGAEIPPVGIIVAVGSGVVNDLGKWLAFGRGIPYASFATAASMNGYTSANVAPTVKGVKCLERAAAPKAVFATPEIIAAAPSELTVAGLGDALAKSVSAADWRLNHALFGDEFIEEAVALVSRIEPLYLERPRDVRDAECGAIGALYEALLLTGVAMTMAGSSAPASGGEHLVSHSLDMMSSLDGSEHDLHGRQVGVGTILASLLYERVFAIESPVFNPAAAIATEFAFWGRLTGSVREAYAPKVKRIESACERLSRGGAWDELRAAIAPLLRPAAKTSWCLREAGGAYRSEHIKCTSERLCDALVHGHEIRSRFTILDLARMTGVMPRAGRELVDGLGG